MWNLSLAILWLGLGLALLAWHWAQPENRGLLLHGTQVPIGWVAILFGLYKLARCWSARSRAQARALDEAWQRARRSSERAPAPEEPDPNFHFPEEPPRPGPGG